MNIISSPENICGMPRIVASIAIESFSRSGFLRTMSPMRSVSWLATKIIIFDRSW